MLFYPTAAGVQGLGGTELFFSDFISLGRFIFCDLVQVFLPSAANLMWTSIQDSLLLPVREETEKEISAINTVVFLINYLSGTEN